MKKIIVFVVVVFIGLIKSSAIEIVVDDHGVLESYEYIYDSIGIFSLYDLGINGSYDVTDTWRLNNLAYIGNNNTYDNVFQATIQMLIWQTTNPEYDFYLTQFGNRIDNSAEINLIESILKDYDVQVDLDGTFYEAEYGKDLVIESSFDLQDFIPSKYTCDMFGNILIFQKVKYRGLNEITFRNRIIGIEDGKIESHHWCPKPFTIKFRVPYESSIVNISTDLMDYKTKNVLNTMPTDVTIKYLETNKTTTCYSEDKCVLTLEQGAYLITDNKTSDEWILNVNSDTNKVLHHYVLNGIISDEKIDQIQKNGEEISFAHHQNLYETTGYLDKDIYTITVDSKNYVIDFSDNTKYVYIDSEGLFYRFVKPYENNQEDGKKEEDKKDEIKPPIEENDQENINNEGQNNDGINGVNKKDEVISTDDSSLQISIPDTGIDISKAELYYEKKKYIFTHMFIFSYKY